MLTEMIIVYALIPLFFIGLLVMIRIVMTAPEEGSQEQAVAAEISTSTTTKEEHYTLSAYLVTAFVFLFLVVGAIMARRKRTYA
jgi:hypothetical protein